MGKLVCALPCFQALFRYKRVQSFCTTWCSVKHSRSAAHRNCTLLLNVKLSMCARVSVPVAVGYEYEVCPGVIHWERRTALMQGFELVPSDLGGWSLDKHHALNIRSGEFVRLFLVLGGWLRF